MIQLLNLCVLLTLICAETTETVIDDSLPATFITLGLFQKDGMAHDTRQKTRRLVEQSKRRLTDMSNSSAPIFPLFQGMGTHYSFIYVGSPPQRVSVIVDTGSHHTAFPCTGCSCGKHMDPYFDPKKSNTSEIPKCSGKPCFFQQSYSEGSSWHAFKVSDKVWMGGKTINAINKASHSSVNFQFGCQDSETGLFRTQHVDGIMGMSAAEDTLPFQLVSQKITKTRIFAMCFAIGGGILTLGGVDQSIHTPGAVVKYARLIKDRGWFTVRLLDVSLRSSSLSKYRKEGVSTDMHLQDGGVSTTSIGISVSNLNGKKGVIVDSGTTDTYLPISVRKSFIDLFKKISDGHSYTNNNVYLTKDQIGYFIICYICSFLLIAWLFFFIGCSLSLIWIGFFALFCNMSK